MNYPIITLKQHPELGKLKIVPDDGGLQWCNNCAYPKTLNGELYTCDHYVMSDLNCEGDYEDRPPCHFEFVKDN